MKMVCKTQTDFHVGLEVPVVLYKTLLSFLYRVWKPTVSDFFLFCYLQNGLQEYAICRKEQISCLSVYKMIITLYPLIRSLYGGALITGITRERNNHLFQYRKITLSSK